MKLLSKQESYSTEKKQREKLVFESSSISQYYKNMLTKLGSLKADYSDDRLKAQKEFDVFQKDLNSKKETLLKELKIISDEIELKKSILYGLIDKQDLLTEKSIVLDRKKEQLDMRESYVGELENKIKSYARRNV